MCYIPIPGSECDTSLSSSDSFKGNNKTKKSILRIPCLETAIFKTEQYTFFYIHTCFLFYFLVTFRKKGYLIWVAQKIPFIVNIIISKQTKKSAFLFSQTEYI